MIRSYSKRLLSPFSGQMQIVEGHRVRALTLDGEHWEMQYRLPPDAEQERENKLYGKPIRQRYVPIASIQNGRTERMGLPAFFDRAQVDGQIDELADYLADVALPFPAADNYEYWLLDGRDEAPLALIFSCTQADEMALYPERPEWTALPAARMNIPATVEEQQGGIPPVNYRLEGLVNERAGRHPCATWFQRRAGETTPFPPLLVSEDWDDEADRQLCQRYVRRQAPLLLMLHGLAEADRLRLEQAARDNVMEVERFYPLYPGVADEQLMAAMRVEARLRGSQHHEPPIHLARM
ncbi:MAG: hypothetical protein U5S82_04050 [Gammaproteobacteria bacterium]|nr:hypothetical protein [Gammaproteobacteria bacterium]